MHLKYLEQFPAQSKYSINASIWRGPSIEELAKLILSAISGEISAGEQMKQSDWPDLSHISTLCPGEGSNQITVSHGEVISKEGLVGRQMACVHARPTPGPDLTRTGKKQVAQP